MRCVRNRLVGVVVLAVFVAGQPPFVRAFHIHPEAPAGTAHKLTACPEDEEKTHDHDKCPFCPGGQCSCSVSAVPFSLPQVTLPPPPICLEQEIVDVAVVYLAHIPSLPTTPPKG